MFYVIAFETIMTQHLKMTIRASVCWKKRGVGQKMTSNGRKMNVTIVTTLLGESVFSTHFKALFIYFLISELKVPNWIMPMKWQGASGEKLSMLAFRDRVACFGAIPPAAGYILWQRPTRLQNNFNPRKFQPGKFQPKVAEINSNSFEFTERPVKDE